MGTIVSPNKILLRKGFTTCVQGWRLRIGRLGLRPFWSHGLGVGFQDLGFRVFGLQDLGFKVSGLG